MRYDVVIVGGGIGGTILAGLLGRRGQRVLVLEKAPAPRRLARPEIIWPATTDVFFSLAARQKLEKDALLCLGGVEIHHDGRGPLVISERLLSEAGIKRWSADPNETREQLAHAGDFELRRGMEVTGLLKEGARYVAVRARASETGREEDFAAGYIIGDDGVHSLVRRECGLEVKTRLFPVDFLCFGFAWPSNFERLTTKVWLNPGGLTGGVIGLFALPLANGSGAGLIAARPWIFDEGGAAEHKWQSFCAGHELIGDVTGGRSFPGDFVRIRRPWGHARRYGTEGVLLVGDAAHPVSPVGGQGTNMAVADAQVLAELLLDKSPRLLEEYERRRRPANARSVRFTRVAHSLLKLPGFCFPAWAVSGLIRQAARHPAMLMGLVRYASGAFQDRR